MRYHIEPISIARRSAQDSGRLARQAHIVHGLIEVDVTDARQLIREYEETSGKELSFTAFLIFCLGKAIEHNPHLHAYRNWRNQLVIYDEVNVVTMIEIMKDGQYVPMPHLLIGVNKTSLEELSNDIHAAKIQPSIVKGWKFLSWFMRLPFFVRRIFYWYVKSVPQLFRNNSSSVVVTAVGMFGRSGGWGIPASNFTLGVTVGGIAEKPGVVDGTISIREFLDLTISVDHDIVDGAPIARFIQQLREYIHAAYGLTELT